MTSKTSPNIRVGDVFALPVGASVACHQVVAVLPADMVELRRIEASACGTMPSKGEFMAARGKPILKPVERRSALPGDAPEPCITFGLSRAWRWDGRPIKISEAA